MLVDTEDDDGDDGDADAVYHADANEVRLCGW